MSANYDHFRQAQRAVEYVYGPEDLEEAKVHALLAIAQQLQILNASQSQPVAYSVKGWDDEGVQTAVQIADAIEAAAKARQEGENID